MFPAVSGAGAAQQHVRHLKHMTLDEFVSEVENSLPPAPASSIQELENEIGDLLPEDYKEFLVKCNGGYVGGRYWFNESVGIHHIGGFRKESYFSLKWARDCYQSPDELRIPMSLMWIMDDPFGNAICLGVLESIAGKYIFGTMSKNQIRVHGMALLKRRETSTLLLVRLPNLLVVCMRLQKKMPNQRVESDSLRRRFAPPPLAAHAQR